MEKMNTKSIVLTTAERNRINELGTDLLERVKLYSDYKLRTVSPEYFEKLPKRLRVFLSSLINERFYTAQIHNLNLSGELTQRTPKYHRSETGSTILTIADSTHSIISFSLGNPIGYKIQQNNRIINDIIPLETNKDRLASSTSSSVKFHFHTEDAFSYSPPKLLCLTCIRNEERAITRFARFDYTLLSSKELQLLSSADFFVLPNSLQQLRVVDEGKKSIIFVAPNGDLAFRYNSERIEGNLTNEQLEALNRLDVMLNENIFDLVFDSGSLTIINNYTVAHSRLAFKTEFTSKKRWLLRSVLE